MSLKPAQGKLCLLGARGRRLKSRRDVAHLAHDFLQIRARSEALLREASDFRFLTEQMLIEELDAAALVRALGLKQRILARPLGGRPLGHLSSRKAGIVRPRGGLFLKPCLHAAEGLGASHDSLEQLRRVFFDRACGTIRGFGGLFFLYASPSSSVRSPAKISVLFLKLSSPLQRHPQPR